MTSTPKRTATSTHWTNYDHPSSRPDAQPRTATGFLAGAMACHRGCRRSAGLSRWRSPERDRGPFGIRCGRNPRARSSWASAMAIPKLELRRALRGQRGHAVHGLGGPHHGDSPHGPSSPRCRSRASPAAGFAMVSARHAVHRVLSEPLTGFSARPRPGTTTPSRLPLGPGLPASTRAVAGGMPGGAAMAATTGGPRGTDQRAQRDLYPLLTTTSPRPL